MNLADLKHFEASATPGPWSRIPWLLTTTGLPTLSGPNRDLLLVLRNAAPELLDVLDHLNNQARLFMAVTPTLQDGRPGPDTIGVMTDYQNAALETLEAHDRLFTRLAAL